MALSVRTLIKEKVWTRLIRSLPEGINEMPTKFKYEVYLTIKATCLRENSYDTDFTYTPNYTAGKVTIIKARRDSDGEPFEQRM